MGKKTNRYHTHEDKERNDLIRMCAIYIIYSKYFS